jgi:small subunit ribosomal protein S30e
MGKVHGSLTRAGKVRNATPKVAKMEKKGKPRVGRSKIRFLCNKRFSSLKEGQRKSKPNSQQLQQLVKAQKDALAARILKKKKESGKYVEEVKKVEEKKDDKKDDKKKGKK